VIRVYARTRRQFPQREIDLLTAFAHQAAVAIENAELYEDIRRNVIAPLTVRRTRTDLQEQEQYREDLIAQNIAFPGVEKPRKIFYPLEPALEDIYDRTMRQLSHADDGLTYNRYRAIQFLKPTLKAKYQHADMVSSQLAKIMKTLLVKRLDSSFHAFRSSLGRFRDATEAMVRMFDDGRVFIAPNENVSQYVLEGREDELAALLAERRDTDPTITICGPGDFDPEFIKGLRADLQILQDLAEAWDDITQDPKLDEFIACLQPEMLDPKHNLTGKLVIFSESKETTDYLADSLKKHGIAGILKVDSHNRHELRNTIRRNFDANYEPRNEQVDDYSILITTEVLAEGVNLHRANVIVNYDTPWNATRLMQRIGRVNRIGSVAPHIYNYVFYPTAKVDNDIELRKKAIMKLQAFHSALGEDSQIYSETEEVENFGLFDKDMKEERDERLDFLMELRRFKADHPGEFRRIKNFPLRARAGRKDKTKTGATVCFIRNRRRDAFCFIPVKGDIQDLSFVDCARHLRATASEKTVSLHAQHHAQVQTAVARFRDTVHKEITASRSVEGKRNPQEQKAVAGLNTVMKLPNISAEEKQLCEAAIHAIGKARFQPLARDIAKLFNSQKTQKVNVAVLIDRLMAIVGQYPLILDDDVVPAAPSRHADAGTVPDIIISESFS
jgi:superfamily II DNA/RNA helicase